MCIEPLAVLGAPSPEIKRMIELIFRGVAGARFSCAATARVRAASFIIAYLLPSRTASAPPTMCNIHVEIGASVFTGR